MEGCELLERGAFVNAVEPQDSTALNAFRVFNGYFVPHFCLFILLWELLSAPAGGWEVRVSSLSPPASG